MLLEQRRALSLGISVLDERRDRAERVDLQEGVAALLAGVQIILEMLSEQGWDDIPETSAVRDGKYHDGFKHLMRRGSAPEIFDFLELAMGFMESDEREKCRLKLNQVFDLHQCPWRIADGEFFKLDAEFMGERLFAVAHDALAGNRFAGASEEYAKARQKLAEGDIKDGIFYAPKSFESVMKVLTGGGPRERRPAHQVHAGAGLLR